MAVEDLQALQPRLFKVPDVEKQRGYRGAHRCLPYAVLCVACFPDPFVKCRSPA